MAFRDREQFDPGINMYVPAMQYSNALNNLNAVMFSLGSPAASDDDIIAATVDADATAGTLEAYAVTLDAEYGRTLIVTVSADPGAAGGVLEVQGWDYLRQPMLERFTGANGATAILYGKKAFKYIKGTKIITATTNAVTYKVGTGTRVGLPYKGDVVWAKENGVMVPVYNRDTWIWGSIGAAEVAAGASAIFIDSPFPGYVKTLKALANLPVGSTNDPVITVVLGSTAITGLTVTVDVSDAGNEQTDTPTTAGYSANNRLLTGTNIKIAIADADASAGLRAGVELTPTQFVHPDITDPGTTVTGDPRGTYEPLTAPSGVELIVGIRGDTSVNTGNNGGLHGIRHYYA